VSEKLSDAQVGGSGLVEKSLSVVKKGQPLLEYGWDVLA
jgi:hypothetical protein